MSNRPLRYCLRRLFLTSLITSFAYVSFNNAGYILTAFWNGVMLSLYGVIPNTSIIVFSDVHILVIFSIDLDAKSNISSSDILVRVCNIW